MATCFGDGLLLHIDPAFALSKMFSRIENTDQSPDHPPV